MSPILYYPSGRVDKPHLLYRQNWVHVSMHWPSVSYKYFKHYCALAQLVSKLFTLFTCTTIMFLHCLAFIVLLLMELYYTLRYSHVTNESYSSHNKDLLSRNTALVLKFELPSPWGKLKDSVYELCICPLLAAMKGSYVYLLLNGLF